LQKAMSESTMAKDEQSKAKQRAFDLLDALTKSGSIVIEDCTLHIVLSNIHFFDHSLLDTVVEANVNPISQMERSALIVASTIHGVSTNDLVNSTQLERIATSMPQVIYF
jgi:hypothetical protein